MGTPTTSPPRPILIWASGGRAQPPYRAGGNGIVPHGPSQNAADSPAVVAGFFSAGTARISSAVPRFRSDGTVSQWAGSKARRGLPAGLRAVITTAGNGDHLNPSAVTTSDNTNSKAPVNLSKTSDITTGKRSYAYESRG
jgi:hypothetical protein